MRIAFAFALTAGFALAGPACGKKGEDQESGGEAAGESAGPGEAAKPEQGTPPFSVTVRKVERLEQVAPNQTHLEQGLGAKAPEGKVFYCVQYELKNTSQETSSTPPAVLVIGEARYEVSMSAAGKYLPEDWKDTVHGKLEPRQSSQESSCFEVEKEAADKPGRLTFTKDSWGKNPGWTLEAPVE